MQKSYSSDWSLYNNPAHTVCRYGRALFILLKKCAERDDRSLHTTIHYIFSNHGFSGLTVSSADSK